MNRTVIAIVFILLYNSIANANGINILSEEHHVWGWAGDNDPGETFAQYDVSGSQPVSAYATGEYYDYNLEFSESRATAGNFSVELLAGRWSAWALGESTYTFTTSSNNLNLSATGYTTHNTGADYIHLSLLDVTTGIFFFDYYFRNLNDSLGLTSCNVEEVFNVNTSHIYQLYMYAEAGTGDSTFQSGWSSNIYSSPLSSPVPEPNTTLLFSIGLAGLVGIVRKNKKSQGNSDCPRLLETVPFFRARCSQNYT